MAIISRILNYEKRKKRRARAAKYFDKSLYEKHKKAEKYNLLISVVYLQHENNNKERA